MQTTKCIATAAFILLGALAGCGGDDQQPSTQQGGLFGNFLKPSAPPEPVTGDCFTILLTSFTDIEHVTRALKSKQATANSTGWSNLFVVHEDGRSSLMMGRYASVTAAAGDLKRANAFESRLPDGTLVRPFATAFVTRVPGPNPGRPEHDLNNASGYYSVVVAHFFNDPADRISNRKELAVECVEKMRQQGYEAYFQHGPSISLVTVGTFGENAFVSQKNANGVVEARLADPKLKQVFRDFPHLIINGATEIVTRIDSATGQKVKGTTGTYVTLIPQQTARP